MTILIKSQLITKITPRDRVITLQFSFNNPFIIPWDLNSLDQESLVQSAQRKQQSEKGSMSHNLMPGSKNNKFQDTKIDDKLVVNLVNRGYELISLKYQERQQTSGYGTYHMTRYTFAHRNYIEHDSEIIQEIKPRRGVVLAQLYDFIQLAYWQIRAYRNPYFDNGEVVEDQKAISLNFDGRTPILDGSELPLDPRKLPKPKYTLYLADNLLNINQIV